MTLYIMNYGKIGSYILLGAVVLTFMAFFLGILLYVATVAYLTSAVFCIISIVKRKNPNESYKTAIVCLVVIALYLYMVLMLFLSLQPPSFYNSYSVNDSSANILKHASELTYTTSNIQIEFSKTDYILNGDMLSELLGLNVYLYFADNFPINELKNFNLVGNKIVYTGSKSSEILETAICGQSLDLVLDSQSLVSYLQGADNEFACHLILSK